MYIQPNFWEICLSQEHRQVKGHLNVPKQHGRVKGAVLMADSMDLYSDTGLFN